MQKPKVLLFDIETSPMLGNVWGLWKNNVSLNQLREDWQMLSWSAKWLGDDGVMYDDMRGDVSDKRILGTLHELLEEADWVITHNGDKFDLPKVRARMLLQGISPFSPVRSIDTCQQAKRVFGFTSNKLQYLSDNLCPDIAKSKHAKFPGFELWAECMRGNMEAWDEMEEYNRQDVVALEGVYMALRPWMTQHPNMGLHVEAEGPVCPKCGSVHLQKRGFQETNVNKYQRYRCGDCGSWSRERYTAVPAEARPRIVANAV